MKIVYKQIKDLIPDTKQPRQKILQNNVREMAISIKNEGIINPIEIDNNNVVITGEMRLRGARSIECPHCKKKKHQGWFEVSLTSNENKCPHCNGIVSTKIRFNKVPCKVLNITPNQKFIRQMQENIHHNTMNAWDTAMGFAKTLEILASSTGKLVRDPHHKGKRYQTGTKELSELYGLSKATISDYLNLLKETEEIQEAIKENKIGHTKLRGINGVPKKYKEKLKKKIVKQNYIPKEGIASIADGLKRAELLNKPEIAKKLLEVDYKDENKEPMTQREVVLEVNRIIPDTQTILANDIDRVKAITKKASELENLLNENSLSSIREPSSKMSLTFQLKTLIMIIDKYLKSQEFTTQIAEEDNIKLIK